MPTDSRRITGPDETKSPYSLIRKDDAYHLQKNADGERPGGRKADSVRPLFIKAGTLSQAKGSAYIEVGNTKVACAVYGPREVAKREDFSLDGVLTCEIKFAPFSCLVRQSPQQSSHEKELSVLLLEALQPAVCLNKFPKSQVNVFVTVLENDGSLLSAAISCASIALADASIEMYDITVACTAMVNGSEILLDPELSEEQEDQESHDDSVSTGSLVMALMPSLNQVNTISAQGQMSIDSLSMAMKQCTDACRKIYPVLQKCLAKSVQSKLDEKAEDT